MRPRLIAVDDGALVAGYASPIMLQGGHGGSPWMTLADTGDLAVVTRLQGGHGGSPWMTGRLVQLARHILHGLQGGHGGSPWMTFSKRRRGPTLRRRFNEATADRRGGPEVLRRA